MSTKPPGIDPIELDGIVMRKSVVVPVGIQALYDEKTGAFLWLGKIGTNPDPRRVRATAITLSHEDYEMTKRSYFRAKIRPHKKG